MLQRVHTIPRGFVRTHGDVSPGERQRALLDAEGVPFRGPRVDMAAARLPE